MNSINFNVLVYERIDKILETLSKKAIEYGAIDRLYNFKRAAAILHTTPSKALAGMWIKHVVSVLDLIEGTLVITDALIDEKIGDSINYLILLEGVLKENITKEKKPCFLNDNAQSRPEIFKKENNK